MNITPTPDDAYTGRRLHPTTPTPDDADIRRSLHPTTPTPDDAYTRRRLHPTMPTPVELWGRRRPTHDVATKKGNYIYWDLYFRLTSPTNPQYNARYIFHFGDVFSSTC